jgi:hypothetical protein
LLTDLNLYYGLAVTVLVLHLLWIVWVIGGIFFTRQHPRLGWFHIASLVYSAVIEIGPWPCPLTLVEQWLWSKAGIASYQGSFIAHYLEAIVYPEIPAAVLTWGGSAFCLVVLSIYWLRLRRQSEDVEC